MPPVRGRAKVRDGVFDRMETSDQGQAQMKAMSQNAYPRLVPLVRVFEERVYRLVSLRS